MLLLYNFSKKLWPYIFHQESPLSQFSNFRKKCALNILENLWGGREFKSPPPSSTPLMASCKWPFLRVVLVPFFNLKFLIWLSKPIKITTVSQTCEKFLKNFHLIVFILNTSKGILNHAFSISQGSIKYFLSISCCKKWELFAFSSRFLENCAKAKVIFLDCLFIFLYTWTIKIEIWNAIEYIK